MSETWEPNANLVVEALIGRIFGTTDHVASSLPSFEKWVESGFVTYENLSGVPGLHLPTRNPLFRLSFWATTSRPGATAPPWAKAFHLAGEVEKALQAPEVRGVFETRSGYFPHYLITAYPTTEPAEVKNDPSGYARVDMSVLVKWAEVSR
jgi:hypothetical protein